MTIEDRTRPVSGIRMGDDDPDAIRIAALMPEPARVVPGPLAALDDVQLEATGGQEKSRFPFGAEGCHPCFAAAWFILRAW